MSQTELKALIADIDAQGLNTSGSTNVKTGVGRMQLSAGRLLSLRALASISVVATGSIIVAKIAEDAGLGGFIYRKITGDTYGSTPPTGTVEWYCIGSSPCNVPSVSSGSVSLSSGWAVNSSSQGWNYCTGSCNGVSQEWSTLAGGLAGTASLTAAGCSTMTTGTCAIKTRTDAQMETAVQIAPSDAAEFASPPAGATTFTGGQADATISDPELEAALDAIDPDPGTAGTAVEQDTAEAILDELDPGWDIGVLLQPLPNETYTAYITRLQDAGYVGTATSTVLTTAEPGYGPEAVVRVITTPAGGTMTVYDPLNWPSPAPNIDNDVDITIRYNPSSAPEAPTTATPTPVTGAPTTIPGTPAIDFSPITELDPGCKFPYGFICYAVDFTEQFDVAADAPVFSFMLGIDQELCYGCEADYTVDLEVMDDYMALWRGILTVVLWVGAIYLVATRMLGFKAGGDPGEAIDDVL